MTRITVQHPTNPKITKRLPEDRAQRFLDGGWTVVDSDEPETIAAGDTDNTPDEWGEGEDDQ